MNPASVLPTTVVGAVQLRDGIERETATPTQLPSKERRFMSTTGGEGGGDLVPKDAMKVAAEGRSIGNDLRYAQHL
jgi:hypothetical protein